MGQIFRKKTYLLMNGTRELKRYLYEYVYCRYLLHHTQEMSIFASTHLSKFNRRALDDKIQLYFKMILHHAALSYKIFFQLLVTIIRPFFLNLIRTSVSLQKWQKTERKKRPAAAADLKIKCLVLGTVFFVVKKQYQTRGCTQLVL